MPPPAEMIFVFDDAEIRFAVVEDQEQVDKVLEIREKVRHLQHIFYDDASRPAQLSAARPAIVRSVARKRPQLVAAAACRVSKTR